jgi:hypothetical protein
LGKVTLFNGESRLCFSSAQVEYARYYVKAVGLVDILLPLPSSHYLITKSTINSVSPIYYDKASTIKKDLSKISKNNKKLKNTSDPRLASLRLVFDHIRAAWLDQNATWVGLDFEAWEMYHQDLTEFGYAMIRFHKGQQVESEEGHWIVLERKHLRNVSDDSPHTENARLITRSQTKYLIDNKDVCSDASAEGPQRVNQRNVELSIRTKRSRAGQGFQPKHSKPTLQIP